MSIREHVSKKGVRSFYAYVRVTGHPTVVQKHASRRDAERWLTRIKSEIYSGSYLPSKEAKKTTLAQLIDRYLEEVLPSKPRDARNLRRQLLWWRGRLGSYSLVSLTPTLIAAARSDLEQRRTSRGSVSAATTNRYLAALSCVLGVARKEWHLIDENPLSKISRRKESRGRVRFLSNEDRNRLLEACQKDRDPQIYPVVMLALGTGMRQGEILSLRWDQIDLTNGTILLDQTKNDERRRVPLRGNPLEALRSHARLRRLDTDLVFPAPRVDSEAPIRIHRIQPAWARVSEAAALKNFRFHDLRHTYASYLAMNGASLLEIAELLGHKSISMTKRYSHLTESHTAKVVENMTMRILG